MKKEDMIFDLIKEVKSELNEIKVNVTDVKEEQIQQRIMIEQNTKDLSDHKEGFIQNRKRIEYLEKPGYLKLITKSNITFILGTIVSIAIILNNKLILLDKIKSIVTLLN